MPAPVSRPRARVQFGEVMRAVERRRSRSADGTAWSGASRLLEAQQAAAAAGGMMRPTTSTPEGLAGGGGCWTARGSRERPIAAPPVFCLPGGLAAETIHGNVLLQSPTAAGKLGSGGHSSIKH
jgi:hypothetical protein